jgi:hypothetical protein
MPCRSSDIDDTTIHAARILTLLLLVLLGHFDLDDAAAPSLSLSRFCHDWSSLDGLRCLLFAIALSYCRATASR